MNKMYNDIQKATELYNGAKDKLWQSILAKYPRESVMMQRIFDHFEKRNSSKTSLMELYRIELISRLIDEQIDIADDDAMASIMSKASSKVLLGVPPF